MPGFNPFDMDFDGDVDGIDFLGVDYLVRRVLRRVLPPEGERGNAYDEDSHNRSNGNGPIGAILPVLPKHGSRGAFTG